MRLWQATHGAVDYVRILQKEHLDMMVDSERIESVKPRLGDVAFVGGKPRGH